MAKEENAGVAGNPAFITSDMATALALIRQTFVSEPVTLADGRQMILAATGFTRHDVAAIDPVLSKDINAHRTFIEPESMIEYVKRFKEAGAIVLAYPNGSYGPKFVALLNYHEGAGAVPDPTVRQNRHVAELKTPWDVDYAIWRPFLHGSKSMKQEEFVVFIENMAHTIERPDAGPLQEIISDLQLRKNVAFKRTLNLRDGTTKLTFEETMESDPTHVGAKGEIVLPNQIDLALSVYQGGEKMTIPALIRFSQSGPQVFFTIKCPQIARIEREEFRLIGDAIRNDCGVPVLYSEE